MPFLSEDEFGPVQVQEGLRFSGTTGRSATNNNPLNIEYLPGSYQDKYGAMPEPTHGGRFAKFPDMMSGYLAGLDQIRIDQARGHTIASFVNKFSPPHQNPTTELIAQYSQAVGANPNTPLAQIPAERIIVPMLARESSTRIVGMEQPQSSGQFFSEEDFNPKPKPQPGKVQSIPDLLGGALGQEGVTPGLGIADMGGGQPAPNLTPETFSQMVQNRSPIQTPSSLESLIGGSLQLPEKPGYMTGNFMQPPQLPSPVEPFKDLPLTGSLVGGEVARRLGGPLGLLAAPVGAGLGYAGTQAGQNVYRALTGQEVPPISDQLGQYGKGFMTGATGWMGGEATGAMASPFANRVAQRMAENPAVREAQALVGKGAPISPSEIADTKTSRFFEWMADKVWPASAVMAKKRNSLQAVAEGLKDEFVASRGLYETSKKGIDKAWNTWVDLAGGPDATYPMPNATAAVNEAMGKPFAQMGTFWKKHAATFQQEAQNGEVTVQGIRNLFNTLSPSSVKGAERSARMGIADAIMKDLGTTGGPEVTEALQNAREITFQNRVVAPLRNIFNQSMVEPTKVGDTVAFNPSKFVNLWNQKRPMFVDNKNYSEADIAAIDKFANQMRAMIPDLAKGVKFTPATSLAGVTQLNLDNPAAVALGVYKMPLLAVPVGMDAMMAQSLMNPNGIMRQLLTTGYKPPTLPGKIGITKYLESKFLGGEND